MKIIGLASKNPVKVAAALLGFQRMFAEEEFEVRSVPVSSGVGHQPLSDDETLRGALGRAQQAQSLLADADYWVGIEGGVQARQFLERLERQPSLDSLNRCFPFQVLRVEASATEFYDFYERKRQ